MEKFDQLTHMNSSIDGANQRKQIVLEIQKLYEEYLINPSDSIFSDLIHRLDEITIPWIDRQLKRKGCYSEENKGMVMQDAYLSIWKTITDSNRYNQIGDYFAYYAFGIYKKKTLDLIRKVSENRKKMKMISIDEDEQKESLLPPFLEDFDGAEVRKVYQRVFRLYCYSLMNAKEFLPRCLALYYARIHPHLFGATPYWQATSIKLAIQYMGSSTVSMLIQDSEHTLKKRIDSNLTWTSYLLDQLEDEIPDLEKKCKLGEVIYTEVYDKKKIEYWADQVHKTLVKDTSNRLLADQELLSLVIEYRQTEDILQKFCKDKEVRER